ncbi:hypothetical protein B0H15DRAFT_796230 [Mycena belliarum]|uniref:Uncharacterized protein n=1 Tax=Mycena belliarum TaxID=1033014 RepID=A0AAD6UFK6_9AGAR|nr:hypothetical protein B0H15DRAFT_796230 [Mycena belliae]
MTELRPRTQKYTFLLRQINILFLARPIFGHEITRTPTSKKPTPELLVDTLQSGLTVRRHRSTQFTSNGQMICSRKNRFEELAYTVRDMETAPGDSGTLFRAALPTTAVVGGACYKKVPQRSYGRIILIHLAQPSYLSKDFALPSTLTSPFHMAQTQTLPQIRGALLGSNEYLASATCVSSHAWRNKAGGHILTGGSDLLVVVGRVADSKLDVVHAGSWRVMWREPMEKAKFVMMLENPEGTIFERDWAVTVDNGRRVQGGICDGTQARNFIVADRAGVMLRFTQNVFEKKKNGDIAGYDPAKWYVPDEMKDTLEGVTKDYHIRPIRVYDSNDMLIDPNTLDRRLLGAVVECAFSFKHWTLKDQKGDPFDTFTGHIEQVVILSEAPPPVVLPTASGGRFRVGGASTTAAVGLTALPPVHSFFVAGAPVMVPAPTVPVAQGVAGPIVGAAPAPLVPPIASLTPQGVTAPPPAVIHPAASSAVGVAPVFPPAPPGVVPPPHALGLVPAPVLPSVTGGPTPPAPVQAPSTVGAVPPLVAPPSPAVPSPGQASAVGPVPPLVTGTPTPPATPPRTASNSIGLSPMAYTPSTPSGFYSPSAARHAPSTPSPLSFGSLGQILRPWAATSSAQQLAPAPDIVNTPRNAVAGPSNAGPQSSDDAGGSASTSRAPGGGTAEKRKGSNRGGPDAKKPREGGA